MSGSAAAWGETMADDWGTISTGIDGPARHAAAVTPDDAADLPNAARGLWVGGAGNVDLITTGGETVAIDGVPAGTILPICTARVLETTTATLIVALW